MVISEPKKQNEEQDQNQHEGTYFIYRSLYYLLILIGFIAALLLIDDFKLKKWGVIA